MLRFSRTTAMLFAATAVTCGGKVVFDGAPGGGPGGGGGGSPTTTSSVTTSITVGQGGAPATTTVTTVGPGPTTTNVSVVSSVVTGPGECTSCSEILQGQQDEPYCPGSLELYEKFASCVCFEVCVMECDQACNGSGEVDPTCEDCLYNKCGEALDACFNDF